VTPGEEELDFHTAFDNDFEVISQGMEEGQAQIAERNQSEGKTQIEEIIQNDQIHAVSEQDHAAQRFQELEDLVTQLKQTIRQKDLQICEQNQMMDNLRSLISSLISEYSEINQSDVPAEIAALRIQMYEHSECYRKEHNDRVMLHQRYKQLKRDCKVYRMERDEARRQADAATTELDRANEELLILQERLQRGNRAHNMQTNSRSIRNVETTPVWPNANVTHHSNASEIHRATLTRGRSSTHNRHAQSLRRSTSSRNNHPSAPPDSLRSPRPTSPNKHSTKSHNTNAFAKKMEPAQRPVTPEQGNSPRRAREVTRRSDVELSHNMTRDADRYSRTSSNGSPCYQRCGAILQSPAITSPGSAPGRRSLQCDHASCVPQPDLTEEIKVNMSGSLSTPPKSPNSESSEEFDFQET